MTPDDDARWMSWRELSQARRTSVHAAQVLARRHKWPRQKANDGTVRVLVPGAMSIPAAANEGEKSDLEQAAAFRAALESLSQAYAEARAMAQALAKQAQEEAQALRGRVEELESEKRARLERGLWERLRAAWRGDA